MADKNITERRKPDGMTDKDWMNELSTKTAAQLAQYDVTVTKKCCDDNCPDHDPDAIQLRSLRDKSLKTTLTAQEVSDHNQAEIRCKAKGLI